MAEDRDHLPWQCAQDEHGLPVLGGPCTHLTAERLDLAHVFIGLADMGFSGSRGGRRPPLPPLKRRASRRQTTASRDELDRSWRSPRTRFRPLRSCKTLTVLEGLRNVLKLKQLACQLGEVRLCFQRSGPEELASLID